MSLVDMCVPLARSKYIRGAIGTLKLYSGDAPGKFPMSVFRQKLSFLGCCSLFFLTPYSINHPNPTAAAMEREAGA